MSASTVPAPGEARGIGHPAAVLGAWPVLVAWAVGLWVAFGRTFASGLGQIQGDLSDARLNNYILEHGYRWLLRMPGHQALWSPPIFYPVPNTGAYSDILLGVAPLYWPWRVAGFAPDTSYQLWMLTVVSFNYVAAVVCCRRLLKVDWPAAAIGSFVFAFGSSRIAQIGHAQLLGQFYWLLALYAIARCFQLSADRSDPRMNATRSSRWIGVLAACVVLQLYGGYYEGWFLVFALMLAFVWAVILPASRPPVLAVGRPAAVAAAAALAGCAMALIPLGRPYLQAVHTVGLRPYSLVGPYLPRVWSWVFEGSNSALYGWLSRFSVFASIPEPWEHHLGIGFVTTLLAGMGLWSVRRRGVGQVMIACVVTVVLVSTCWPNGRSAWIVVYRDVPGAAAVRGVSRIALALLIPAGIGCAVAVERWRRWPAVVAVIGLVVAAEQWQALPSYDKGVARERAEAVARGVSPHCVAFLYTPRNGAGDPWLYQTDAMWASVETGVPTVNGYSGNIPPGWTFYRNMIGPGAADTAVTRAIQAWAARWSLDASRLCRVTS